MANMTGENTTALVNISTARNFTIPMFLFPTFPPMEPPFFELPFEFYMDYSFYLNAVISPIICVIGFVGNILGIYIMWKDSKNQNMSIFLYMLALMVLDMIYLGLGISMTIYVIIEQFDRFLGNMLHIYSAFPNGYIDYTLYHASSCLLIIMSLERLHALACPFTLKQSILSKYPYVIIFSITIFFAIFILPFPFCHYAEALPDFFEPNKTVYFLKIKPDMRQFADAYFFLETIFAYFYPGAMLALNTAIPIIFHRVVKRRKETLKNKKESSKDTQQVRVTLMVMWVSFLYILLAIPKIFQQTLVFLDPRYNFDGIYGLHFMFFTFTGDVFARLNAANDFFVYILISDRYRKILKNMFCKTSLPAQDYVSESSKSGPTANTSKTSA